MDQTNKPRSPASSPSSSPSSSSSSPPAHQPTPRVRHGIYEGERARPAVGPRPVPMPCWWLTSVDKGREGGVYIAASMGRAPSGSPRPSLTLAHYMRPHPYSQVLAQGPREEWDS